MTRGKNALSRHPLEPSQRHQTSKILRGGHHKGTAAKRKDHETQHAIRPEFLSEDRQERGGPNVGHKEDTENGVVLAVCSLQRLLQSMGLRVAEIGLVEAGE